MSTFVPSDGHLHCKKIKNSKKGKTFSVMEVFQTKQFGSLLPSLPVSRLGDSQGNSVVFAKEPSVDNEKVKKSQRGTGGSSASYGLHLQQIESRLMNRPSPSVFYVPLPEGQDTLVSQNTSSNKEGNDFSRRLGSITDSNAKWDHRRKVHVATGSSGTQKILPDNKRNDVLRRLVPATVPLVSGIDAVNDQVPTDTVGAHKTLSEDEKNEFMQRLVSATVPLDDDDDFVQYLSFKLPPPNFLLEDERAASKPKPRHTRPKKVTFGLVTRLEVDNEHIFDSIGSPQIGLKDPIALSEIHSNTANSELSHRLESSSNTVEEHGDAFGQLESTVRMSQSNSFSFSSLDSLVFADSIDEAAVERPVLPQSIPMTAEMIEFVKSVSVDLFPSAEEVGERPIPAPRFSLMKRAIGPSGIPKVSTNSLRTSEASTQLQSFGLPILLSHRNQTDVSSDDSGRVADCLEKLGEVAIDPSSAGTEHHSNHATTQPAPRSLTTTRVCRNDSVDQSKRLIF